MLILPFRPSIGHYDFDTDIEDRTYIFDVQWNARDNVDPNTGVARGAWYFDVREQDGAAIALGIKIVLGTYLGRRLNHPLFRRGVLLAIDTAGGEGRGRDAGFDDLGTRVIVKYYTTVEIDTILQELRLRLAREAVA